MLVRLVAYSVLPSEELTTDSFDERNRIVNHSEFLQILASGDTSCRKTTSVYSVLSIGSNRAIHRDISFPEYI